MASDVAIVATAPDTDVRCVIVANSLWLFAHGYHVDANREVIIDPSGEAGFAVGLLDEAGLTPATRAA